MFDHILTNRIGLGKGQLSQFSILSLIDFVDGFAILFLTVLLQILRIEWDLTDREVIILGTGYFVGMMLGLLFQGLFADQIGRKNLLCLSTLLTFFCMLIHSRIENFNQALLLRTSFGFLFGTSIYLSLILMSEQVPVNYRGRVVASLQMMYLFGMFYFFLCGWIFLDGLQGGNWRAIFVMNSIPIFICFVGSVFIIKESARFRMSQGRFTEAIEILNDVGKSNHDDFQPLDNVEKDKLIRSQLTQKHTSRNILDLFNEENRVVTSFLWPILILWHLQCASIFIIAPFILSHSGQGLFQMFISYFWEFPATLLALTMIDSKQYGGRKRMVLGGLILFVGAEFMIYRYRETVIVLGLTLIRVADKIVWLALNQLKMESYSTYYRTLGVGTAQAVGKAAASFSSVVVFSLYAVDPYFPFIVLGTMSLITISLVAFYPVDLTQRPLDEGLQQ